MSGNRRTGLLLAVLLALAGYYGWQLLGGSDSGRGSVSSGRRDSAPIRRAPAGEIAELAVDELELEPGVYKSDRDLFSYEQPRQQRPQQRQPPPAPKPEPVEQPKPEVSEAPAKPQPPAVDVKYLGSFGRAGRRIAVFTDGDAVYNALVGDVIKDKFILVAIGFESADLGFVGFPEAAPARLAAGRMR